MFDKKFSEVHDVRDPLEQFKLATELLVLNQQLGVEISRLRKLAIDRAVTEYRMNYVEVADAVNLTKSRITQIRKAAPPKEREFFGYGPVTIAIPQRNQEGRQFSQVDYGDLQARNHLQKFLEEMALETKQVEVEENQPLNFLGDVVAICGPKNSTVIQEVLTADQRIKFIESSSGSWELRTQAGDKIEGKNQLGYIGRLPMDGRDILVIAGLHVAGSIGAINYLTTHLAEIYQQVGTDNFSMLIDSKLDGAKVHEAEVLMEARPL